MTGATYPQSQAIAQEWSNWLATQAVHSREALARLYAVHAPQLYRYFWFHTRSRALAEDLVSETFLSAMGSLAGYRPEQGPFNAWLYSIAHRALARHYGEKTTAPIEMDDPAVTLNPEARRPALSVDERIDLWRALGELSPLEREIVALKFGVGLAHAEIAVITGRRATHVAVVLYRALRRLRARLSDGEGEDAEGR